MKGELLAADYRERSGAEMNALAWVPQDPATSFNPATKLNRARQRAKRSSLKTGTVLAAVGLSESVMNGIYPDQLSGGQLQRLTFARALLGGATVLLLEEVTSSLDEEAEDEICELILSLKKRVSMLLMTHDKRVAYKVCDRPLELTAIPEAATAAELNLFTGSKFIRMSRETASLEMGSQADMP